jgi:hypothetical protein
MIKFGQFLNEAAMKSKVGDTDADRHFKNYINPEKIPSLTMKSSHEGISAGSEVKVLDKKEHDGRYHALVKNGSNSSWVPIHKLNKPRTSESKAKFNDEHAVAKVWNHMISNGITKKEDIMGELESAKKNKEHPLNFSNTGDEGMSGGKKTDSHFDSYHDEIQRAGHTVAGLANHPSFKDAVKKKLVARVTGADRGNLSDTWTTNNAKDRTSKADVILSDPKTKKDYHPISLKKGDSQLMSAQPEEMMAIYHHAANEHMKTDQTFNNEHKNNVIKQISQVQKHMNAMKTASETEKDSLVSKAQSIINNIHKNHPGLINHVAREASTGHGKFGKNQVGTARYLVTALPDGAHVHDTEINHEPIVPNAVPRIAKPKGGGRPGNIKLDYRANKLSAPTKKSVQTNVNNKHKPSVGGFDWHSPTE